METPAVDILLDDEPFAVSSTQPEACVGDIIAAARSRLEGTNRMVLGLRCDDREVSSGQVAEVLGSPLSAYSRVVMISGRAEDIVLDVLRETRQEFEESFAAAKSVSESLSAGRIAEAMSRLVDCVGVWGQAHQAVVDGAQLLGLDLDAIRIDGQPLQPAIIRLTDALRQLKGAIESRDHVLLGDILNYELDETLQTWERLLGTVIAHIEDRENAEKSRVGR